MKGADRPAASREGHAPAAGRRRAFALASLLLAALLIEGLSWAALVAASRLRGVHYQPVPRFDLPASHRRLLETVLAGKPTVMEHHPSRGWTPTPGRGGKTGTINAQGLRAAREYAEVPDPDRTRVSFFGDSFTYGADVADPFTIEECLARLDPDLEVLNFGVSGYGTDQAFVRYQEEGQRYHPRIVVIGFMTENIQRLVSVYRPFYFRDTGVPFAKPRFRVVDGRLELVPNPMPDLADYRRLLDRPAAELARMGEHDYYYHHAAREGRLDLLASVRLAKLTRQVLFPDLPVTPSGDYRVEGEAFEVTWRLLAAFHRRVEADGSAPLILVLPWKEDVQRFRNGNGKGYQPLLDRLADEGLHVLDGMDAFVRHGADRAVEELALSHYTPLGNRLIAREIHASLAARGLLATGAGRGTDEDAASRRLEQALAEADALIRMSGLKEAERDDVLAEVRAGFAAKRSGATAGDVR